MDAPKVNLRFELSELLALQRLAQKHATEEENDGAKAG